MRFPRANVALWAVVALATGAAFPARADIPPPDYDFQWANVTDLNNPAYPGGPPVNGNAGRGSVSYKYRIAKLEITTQQWADFLSMVLRQGVNPNTYSLKPNFWGASQSGNHVSVSAPMRPVMGLNWRAGAYYCNWLHNGKQESWASCLSGAYDASTFGGVAGQPYTDQLYHSPGAKFWIPTLDEYLKASHYDPSKNGPGQGGWWAYPYKSDSPPIPGAPGVGQTTGGWDPGDFSELGVDLGAYTQFTSAYGLWDLSGGAREWIEDPAAFDSATGHFVWRRNFGSYAGDHTFVNSDLIQRTTGDYPASGGFYGFRIAGQIPAPSVVMVAFVGSAGFLFRRRAPRASAQTAAAIAAITACLTARADIPPPDYDFQWANITDLNNPALTGVGNNAGRGSVSHKYRISRLEVTTQQWADFLNMARRQGVNVDSPRLRPGFWGASDIGGQYVAHAPLRPVMGLNWRAGAYYCNWLNNGKQESWESCQYGAYDTSTFGTLPDGTFSDQLAHSPDAKFWIPTLDEWLKAAHYDPVKGGAGGWWTYPYRSDSPPTPGPPGVGQTTAGWQPGGFAELLVPLGAYHGSVSAYGLWDLSGGASEWLEEPKGFTGDGYLYRGVDGSRAGSSLGTTFDRAMATDIAEPYLESFFGFRIAGQIPSPSGFVAVIMGVTACAFRRTR